MTEPARIGRYRLARRLASGGMAEIFEAEPVDRPGERLALKAVSAVGAPKPKLKRFLDEHGLGPAAPESFARVRGGFS